MDELTREIRDEVPWCMLFANDIVLINEISGRLSQKLERWRYSLESRKFRLSRYKIEYLRCGFSGVEKDSGEVTMGGVVVLRLRSSNIQDQSLRREEILMRILVIVLGRVAKMREDFWSNM